MDSNDNNKYTEDYGTPSAAGTPAPVLTERQRLRRQMGGAAAVGGVAGLLLVGPIVALAAAGGAAVVAARAGTDSKGGNLVRATGEVVATGCASTSNRIRQFEQNRKYGQRTRDWFSSKFDARQAKEEQAAAQLP